MKAIMFVTALLLSSSVSLSQQNDQLTPQQTDQIKTEVKVAYDSIYARWVRLDSTVFDYFLDSPDWMMCGTDGRRGDLRIVKRSLIKTFKSTKAINWTCTRQDFLVLAKDLVLCSVVGKQEMLLQSGDKALTDPSARTIVFRKVSGQWKVIYIHDSGDVKMQKASK